MNILDTEASKIHHLCKTQKNNTYIHFDSSDEKATESDALHDVWNDNIGDNIFMVK